MSERRTVRGSRTTVGGRRSVGGVRSAQHAQTHRARNRATLLGFEKNLGLDVVHTVAGLPAGAVTLASALAHDVSEDIRHPRERGVFSLPSRANMRKRRGYQTIVKPTLESYKETYGPLAHGDVDKTLRALYEHPLGPIMDAVTIATAGAGGAARLGATAGRIGAISDASRLAPLTKLGERATLRTRSPRALHGDPEGDVFERLTHTNPLIRGRQQLVHGALQKLPYETPLLGEGARFGKGMGRRLRQPHYGELVSRDYSDYKRAAGKLTKEEFVALHQIGNDLHPLDYAQTLERLRDQGHPVEPSAIQTLRNPKVVEAFEAPSKRLQNAAHAAAQLAARNRDLKIERGILSPEAAEARVGKHRGEAEHILSGGSWEPPRDPLKNPALDQIVKFREGIKREYDALEKKGLRGGYSEHERPRTEDEARARMTVLEQRHEAFRQQASQIVGVAASKDIRLTKGELDEQRIRNVTNKKISLRDAGVTRTGRAAGHISKHRGTRQPDVKEELLAHGAQAVDEAVEAALAKLGDHPAAAQFRRERDELHALQAALEPDPDVMFGGETKARDLGTVTAASYKATSPRLELVGGALAKVSEKTEQGFNRAINRAERAGRTQEAAALRARRDEVLGHDPSAAAAGRQAAAVRGSVNEPTQFGEQPAPLEAAPAAERATGAEMRPTPGTPFYVPDYVRRETAPLDVGAKRGRGQGVAKPPQSARRNQSVNFHLGRLTKNVDQLGPDFLDTLRFALADDLHGGLMDAAAAISEEQVRAHPLPKGWDFVAKEVVNPRTGLKRAQALNRVRQADIPMRSNEDLLRMRERLADKFKVTDYKRDAARDEKGNYLIVPQSMLKQAVGEFTRSSGAVDFFLGKPTRVWRALVLGARLGFLTNNVVGNHLLYAIKAGGPTGLRAYLNAVKKEHGPGMVKTLLNDGSLPPRMRDKFMREFFPEQVHGTFGTTARPEEGGLLQGRKGRKVRALTAGVVPATQAVAESNLRRAFVEHYIRKSPEFKKVYNELPKQARDFEQAAAKLIRGEGGDAYREMISKQVNDSLGDYLGLGPLERGIRSVVPFYTWYRAILRITAHLALDDPVRAQIVAKLGQLGAAQTDELGLPEFARDVVPLGEPAAGEQDVVTTRGFNPFSTITELGRGVSGSAFGAPGDTGRAVSELGVNPFVLGAAENIAGKDFFSGRTLERGRLPGIAGATVEGVFEQLPQKQLAAALTGHGRESKLYGKQTGREALLQYAGIPKRRVSLAQAHYYKAQGR